MSNGDNARPTGEHPHPTPSPTGGGTGRGYEVSEDWGERVRSIKIDHKALVGAVGLMLMSWAALPVVYWLLVRKKKEENLEKEKKENE